MTAFRFIAIVTSALILGALAGCATTRIHMMTSTDRLERAAEAFAAVTPSGPVASDATTGYLWEAREFVDETHDFRETLEDHAGDREVTLAFEHMWHSYHALRDDVDRSGSRQVQDALKPVTEAFLHVEHEMTGVADTALYARGGYKYDPYYTD
jgi:hypothetical protein